MSRGLSKRRHKFPTKLNVLIAVFHAFFVENVTEKLIFYVISRKHKSILSKRVVLIPLFVALGGIKLEFAGARSQWYVGEFL